MHTINPRFSKLLNLTNFHCKGAWVEQKCARADPKNHPRIGTLCFLGSSYVGVMIWRDKHIKFEFTRIMPGVYCELLMQLCALPFELWTCAGMVGGCCHLPILPPFWHIWGLFLWATVGLLEAAEEVCAWEGHVPCLLVVVGMGPTAGWQATEDVVLGHVVPGGGRAGL